MKPFALYLKIRRLKEPTFQRYQDSYKNQQNIVYSQIIQGVYINFVDIKIKQITNRLIDKLIKESRDINSWKYLKKALMTHSESHVVRAK